MIVWNLDLSELLPLCPCWRSRRDWMHRLEITSVHQPCGQGSVVHTAILKEWLKIHGNVCADATLHVDSLFLLHMKVSGLRTLLTSCLTKMTCKILAVKKIWIIRYHWEIPKRYQIMLILELCLQFLGFFFCCCCWLGFFLFVCLVFLIKANKNLHACSPVTHPPHTLDLKEFVTYFRVPLNWPHVIISSAPCL